MKYSLSTVLFLMSLTFAFAQSFVGATVDNFAGIHGVIYNPANIVNSNYKLDINLVAASSFGGSDYFGVNVGDLLGGDGFDLDDDTERFPSDENNFFTNVDAMGPSFMFNINDKSSIGFISRARGIVNLNNIDGEFAESIFDEFEDTDDFNFNSPNLVQTTHVWAEIGISYGRILMNKPNHLLTGGITLKYLQGAGVQFASTPGLQGQYTASTETLTTNGQLNYGLSENFDPDDVEFDNLKGGFGMDIGFVYEWHPDSEDDDTTFSRNPYKLKIGLSVTDIGSITYDDVELTNYNMNASVSTTTFGEDLQDFLDNNYNATSINQKAKIQLPTALHILADYRISRKWLVSAQADLSLVNSDDELTNRMINTLTFTPRFESKWFSFYAPFSFRQYGDVAFGGGFRFGPVSLGSGSIFSNLLSDSSKTTDVFVALRIPIYRKQ